MKIIFLLILLTGCASRRFYQGLEVSQELRMNEAALGIVMATMESDFEKKAFFFNDVRKKSQDQFVMNGLREKFEELKSSKDSVMKRTSYIKGLNQKLLKEVDQKAKISEGDPAFEAIEDFASDKEKQLLNLQKEFANYQKAAEEFENLAFHTRMVKI